MITPTVYEARRNPGPPLRTPKRTQKTSDKAKKKPPKIRCPKCAWEPGQWDFWSCSCGCIWNTFTTRGRCPDCSRQWSQTQCLSCQAWSAHEDWYAEE